MFKLLFAAALTLICGCSNQYLYYGTSTVIGIDASADGGTIGMKNSIVHTGPNDANDPVEYDVLGHSDIELGFFNAAISETIALGDAAICASFKDSFATFAPAADPNAPGDDINTVLSALGFDTSSNAEDPRQQMVFGAFTSWSLIDLSMGNSPQPGISFGYKRIVGLRAPVNDGHVAPAFSSFTLNTTKNNVSGAPGGSGIGTRVVNTFATGKPAIIKATQYSGTLNNDETYQGCIDFASD